MNNRMDPGMQIGAVHLTVRQLDRSLTFYRQNIGFQVRRQDGDMVILGAGQADLLLLTERPDAPEARGTTGLYHFAILVPSRRDLAWQLHRLAQTRTPLQGFADHLVSEAIYLADPDGNGIEIYRDRPRQQWPRRNGQLQMASDPLDVDGILAELGQVEASDAELPTLPAGTTIGHMHLHVAHLDQAEDFYIGVLGLDLVTRYGPSAAFVSAGGYHHHIGLNTWAGVGAPPPPAGAIGLRWFELRLPNDAARDQVVNRIHQAGIQTSKVEQGLLVRDPAANGIILTSRSL
jgi:catechol 2,3-dioxygenase